MGSFVNQTLLAELTPTQKDRYDEDRRPALYASLVALLVINNVVVGLRCFVRYHAHYKQDWDIRNIFWEDPFIVISAVFLNASIANLIAATTYGFGLHSWRINVEDPLYPQNLSYLFRHVWITQILQGSTFTCIKLSLLFFYKRVFLVNQKWLRLAFRITIGYVTLWFVGATGFFIFQCIPVQWYYMQYYASYNRQPPYTIMGQCNATTATHAAIITILNLISGIIILALPIIPITQLQIARKAKLELVGIFSIGATSCFLDIGRIAEVWANTDNRIDPSYGIVTFFLLSVATEVGASVCACLPVVGPTVVKEYKLRVMKCSHEVATDWHKIHSDNWEMHPWSILRGGQIRK